MSNKNNYSQYYTKDKVGSLLCSQLDLSEIDSAIDLCMGEGSLLNSLHSIKPKTRLVGCDIDALNISLVSENNLNNIELHHLDTTSAQAKKVFANRKFDLVLGNPPFMTKESTETLITVFNSFEIEVTSKHIELETFFLLYGLTLLKPKGILSYIIPDGVLTNIKWKNLRKVISTRFTILSVTELNETDFHGTEAKTHIINIKNDVNTRKKILLQKVGHKPIYITLKDFIYRADYSYNLKNNHRLKIKKNEQVIFFRGLTPHNKIKNVISELIHTTSFSSKINIFENLNPKPNNQKLAISGDIVIPRVGTRCIGKVGYINQGYFHITDCIIVIRCTEVKLRENIFQYLCSESGRQWVKSISKGVGAKHITLTDIKTLSITGG